MPTDLDRRLVLKGALAALVPGFVACTSTAKYTLTADPFTLGVASGSPQPDGMVLWTRLLPASGRESMPFAPIQVHWEVADDPGFHRTVVRGETLALPLLAHSVHVEVRGLRPGRWYWYRFRAGNATSPPGRTRTAPPDLLAASSLRFAFASCQDYAAGFYDAWAHLAKQDVDLIVFLGDYIYESAFRPGLPRAHAVQAAATLAQYRDRYAQYKSDADLQRAHAAAPWIVTMDDHEVGNDFANDSLQDDGDAASVMARRAQAYQAWYEHMPVRWPFARAVGEPHMRVYGEQRWGSLANFYLTDIRQYRNRQACPPEGRFGGNVVRADACPERAAPARTILGPAQEGWLTRSVAASSARWNIVSQQTLFSKLDIEPAGAETLRTDGWDGYPAARQRLLDAFAASRPANLVSIGGDVHSHWVSDVRASYDRPDAKVIGTEFCTTSISSQTPRWLRQSQDVADQLVRKNPHIQGAWVERRGYCLVDLTHQRMDVQLKVVDDATRIGTPVTNAAAFAVESGRPGAQRA